MDWLTEPLGLLTALLSVGGTLVAVVVYLTRLQLQGTKRARELERELVRLKAEREADTQRLTAERRDLQRQLGQVEGQVSTLQLALASARQNKQELAEALEKIERSLSEARSLTGASGDAVLICDPFDSTKMIFLAAHGGAARKIRHLKVPVDGSTAGAVLKSGEPRFHSQPRPSHEHYTGVDRKADHTTRSMVTLPLSIGPGRVGVVQLLNKIDGSDFRPSDVALLHHLLHPIATAIDRIARDPDAPRVLDFQEPVFTGEAVALFGDLTNSSQVLGRLTATEAATMLDEYIERLCDVGLRFGGSIDRYLGDGFFLRFNAPQPVTHYGAAAVECALAMQDEFTELTGEWESLFPSCEETSPCHQQGHWQSLSAEALRQASTPSSQPPPLRRSTRGSRSSACRTGSSG